MISRVISLFTPFKTTKGNSMIINSNEDRKRLNSQVLSFLLNNDEESLIEIRKSKIEGGGKGVFACKNIKKDSILSLYCGPYKPPIPIHAVVSIDGEPVLPLNKFNEEITKIIAKEQVDYFAASISSDYKIHCSNNGGSLDAKNEKNDDVKRCSHLVNHPPKGQLPNALCYDFSWRDFELQGYEKEKKVQRFDVQRFVNPLAEDFWYYDVSTEKSVYLTKGCAYTCGMAFFSSRDIIKGEEIYFDYKYKIDSKLPKWYSPVDYSQEK